MKSHIEPKRQIKMADGFVQRHHYLPKSVHTTNVTFLEIYFKQISNHECK